MISADLEPVASRHYFDREFDISAVKLLPGEYYVTSRDMAVSYTHLTLPTILRV